MEQVSPFLCLGAGVDLWSAIRENDAFGLASIILLVVLSIVSCTIIALKILVVGRASGQSRRFKRVIDREGSWDALFHASQRYKESPLANLLRETYVECRLENWFDGKGAFSLEDRLSLAKSTIECTLLRTMANEEQRLQKTLWALSTIATLAPFIGLFGTVWGVLAAFQAIGREGSAALSALAPGISTALVTTIFGLFVAIPAFFAYNYLMKEVVRLSSNMESFSHEIENAVRRQILTGEERGAR